MKLSDIKPNPDNPRVLRDDRFQKLKKSIQEFPKMLSLRPMVIDADNYVLGGNMRLRALQDLGYKEIPDNWVRRADDLTDDEKRRFIIADNVSFGEWDFDELANNWEASDLTDWGLDIPVYGQEESDEPSGGNDDLPEYSKKVKAPTYQPTKEQPPIVELYNASRYEELIAEIDSSSVPEDIKTFLKVAASRHIVFDYENIAEFYAHSSADIQQLFENSALVIIDLDKAIEQGYVRLTKQLFDIYEEQQGEDEA